MSRTLENVACTACGCVCDDLQVTLEKDQVVAVSPPCPLAEKWFAQAQRLDVAPAYIADRPCPLPDAIHAATNILRAAQAPLIYGLSSSSTPGQRAAVALADHLRATIDTSASTCHGPSILAVQEVGESTCTLGEIRHRADLVIYWGSNPAKSQPRHMERYSLDPVGEFVPAGRAGRKLIVFDVQETPTTTRADQFVCMERGSDFDLLWTLRALVQGLPIAQEHIGGVAVTTLRQIVEQMKTCRCGVFFFGRGLTAGTNGHAHVQALLMLVRDLNAYTRFHARRMRVFGDVAGADSVLAWQTGFPFSVNLARGYPRYSPGEYSAAKLLERKEVDACVLVGSEGLNAFSAAALAELQKIPTVLIDHPQPAVPVPTTVRITTGVYGIHHAGTAYRMDEVPIPLRPLIASPWPSDAEVLGKILDNLKAVV
jgi:formylmethanofuran dehydrogenase subunit B